MCVLMCVPPFFFFLKAAEMKGLMWLPHLFKQPLTPHTHTHKVQLHTQNICTCIMQVGREERRWTRAVIRGSPRRKQSKWHSDADWIIIQVLFDCSVLNQFWGVPFLIELNSQRGTTKVYLILLNKPNPTMHEWGGGGSYITTDFLKLRVVHKNWWSFFFYRIMKPKKDKLYYMFFFCFKKEHLCELHMKKINISFLKQIYNLWAIPSIFLFFIIYKIGQITFDHFCNGRYTLFRHLWDFKLDFFFFLCSF